MKPVLAIGPLSKDILINKTQKIEKTGGALYYQSQIYQYLKTPYQIILSLRTEDKNLINNFPNPEKIHPIYKKETITFTNKYLTPEKRIQTSNFANTPITIEDIKPLTENINFSAIILNPLLKTDFNLNIYQYLNTLKTPIYLSIQGLLRTESKNNQIKLEKNKDLNQILPYITGLFLDQFEAQTLYPNDPLDLIAYKLSKLGPLETIITQAHKGSLIHSKITNTTISVPAVKVQEENFPTGAGDTYMAAYISQRLNGYSINYSAEFASEITSKKIEWGKLI